MKDNEYKRRLEQQYLNSNKKGIRHYLKALYKLVDENLMGDNILEIGADLGISSNFINRKNLTHTDLLDLNNPHVIGNVDAVALPYLKNSFDSAFAVDAIHHVSSPHLAILELCRVVRPGGRVVLVEPYISPISYWVYKFFHSETTTWNFEVNTQQVIKPKLASEGEQSTVQSLFKSTLFVNLLDEVPNKEIEVNRILIHPFSFPITGGLTNPLPIFDFIVKFVLILERILPQKILPFFAFRQVVILSIFQHKNL